MIFFSQPEFLFSCWYYIFRGIVLSSWIFFIAKKNSRTFAATDTTFHNVHIINIPWFSVRMEENSFVVLMMTIMSKIIKKNIYFLFFEWFKPFGLNQTTLTGVTKKNIVGSVKNFACIWGIWLNEQYFFLFDIHFYSGI